MRPAVIIFISVLSTCYSHAITVGGLEYSLFGSYASITGISTGNTSKTIVVPSSIMFQGIPYIVNTINHEAFSTEDHGNNPNIKNNGIVQEVLLPSTIEVIGNYAFANKGITMVQLNEGVKTIGACAFKGSSISKLNIPSSVEQIQHEAFLKCQMLTEVILNEGLTSIRSEAFAESSIIELIIPSSVQEMGEDIFWGCDMLQQLIYLGDTPPKRWVATSKTYVPDKEVYGVPYDGINYAKVTEMLSFPEKYFVYNGRPLNTKCTNNVVGYNTSLQVPEMKWEVGTHEAIIPATFTKEGKSFTAKIPFKYTIAPAKLKIKANNTSRTYGEPNPRFSISYNGFVNGENESVLINKPVTTTTANIKSPIGLYPITVNGGEAKNYTIEYESGSLTIEKAPLSFQVEDARKVYGNDNPIFSLLFSGLKNDEQAPEWNSAPKYITSATKGSDAGTYSVSVTCDPQNYYIVANKPGTLTITKAPLTIKVDDVSMDYCGAMPIFTYQYSGFVMGEDETALTTLPTISTEAKSTSDSGSYIIKPIGAQAKNYVFTYIPGLLTINQRPLIVKANSASRLYGENNPIFNVTYEGFVNGETKNALDVEPKVSSKATILSDAGIYDINVSGGRAKNYVLNYVNGQLTIDPRLVKAFVRNYERPFGEDNPEFAIEYEGLIGNDTEASFKRLPIARTSATKNSNVGTYDIEVTGGYSPNYIFTYGSGQLIIVKAEQEFTWNQDLTNLKTGDQVLLQAKASSSLPITYIIDSDKYAEIYQAGRDTYMECKAAGSFHVKAVQEGNDNYYSTQRINKEVVIVGDGEYKPTLFIKQADNGMIGTKVDKGHNFTFTIHANTGWRIHSVSFNDVDMTDDLNNNSILTTPAVNSNSTLSVVYEEVVPATVNPLRNNAVRINSTSFGARVTNATIGDVVQVYTTDGILQKSFVAERESIDIPLKEDNVYIIKVADKTTKLRH